MGTFLELASGAAAATVNCNILCQEQWEKSWHKDFLYIFCNHSDTHLDGYCLLFQILNLLFVNPDKQCSTHDHRDNLSQREGIPDGSQSHILCKQVSQRQQAQKLSGNGGQQAVNPIAQGLEHGAYDDAVSGEQEAEADGPQGRNSDFQHLLGGIEQQQHGSREDLEDGKPHQHNGDGNEDTEFGCVHDALSVPCAVVEGNNGDHAVVQSEDGHEDKALELKVHTQHRHGGSRKAYQNQVQEIGHHGADGLHYNRRNAYLIDDPDSRQAGSKAPHADADIGILPDVEEDGQHHGQNLAGNRGNGSAADAKGRTAAQPEDHDRVQDNIGDGACTLGIHIVDGPSGGLENPFQHNLHKDAKGKHQTDGQVLDSVLDDHRIIGLAGKVGPGSEDSKEGKGQSPQDGQKNAVDRCSLSFLLIALSQGPGKKGIDAYAGSAGHGDHQALDGEGHGHGGQGLLP